MGRGLGSNESGTSRRGRGGNSSTPIVPNVIEDDGRAISTPSATEVPVELRPTSENELNLGTTFEGADRRASSTRREHGSPSNSVLQPTPFASAAAQSSPEAATALLSGLLERLQVMLMGSGGSPVPSNMDKLAETPSAVLRTVCATARPTARPTARLPAPFAAFLRANLHTVRNLHWWRRARWQSPPRRPPRRPLPLRQPSA